ncbi:uncharacterized protein METZ01_LOCUS220555 [marine metagenome]|uniref:Methyltransferase domain-containing protein n=1 Tax=marine metagenome TaxID=408172 RepID=A0A382G0H2_9ZZZZ
MPGLMGHEASFCQSEWLGVTFSSLDVELSVTDLPTSDFYSAFYARLADKYGTYDNLPRDWRESKTSTSGTLANIIEANSTVLSFGCGIGFVEYALAHKRPDLNIYCHDFADVSGSWPIANLDNVKLGETSAQSVESGGRKFDVIYLCQVLYAIPSEEAIKLLVRLAAHLNNGGLLILINSSGVPEENGQDQEPDRAVGLQQLAQSLMEVVKKFWRPLLVRTSRVQHPQFWGWQRDNRRYQAIIEEAGLKAVDVFPASGQSFQLTRRVQDPRTQQGFR